jgi:hypothetical protein
MPNWPKPAQSPTFSAKKMNIFQPKKQHFPPKNQHNCSKRDPDVNDVTESAHVVDTSRTNFISVLTDIDIESYDNCNKISNEVTVLDGCSLAMAESNFKNNSEMIDLSLTHFCSVSNIIHNLVLVSIKRPRYLRMPDK